MTRPIIVRGLGTVPGTAGAAASAGAAKVAAEEARDEAIAAAAQANAPTDGQVGTSLAARGLPTSGADLSDSTEALVDPKIDAAVTAEEARAEATYVKPAQVGVVAQRSSRAATPKRPVTAASPPTITAGAAQSAGDALTVASAITGPVAVTYPANPTQFFTGGGPASSPSFGAVRNDLLLTTDGVESLWRIEWITDAPDFEIAIRHVNGGSANHRLMVEGEWVNAPVAGTGSGSRVSYRVQHATRTARRHVLWIDGLAFMGLVTTSADSVWAPLADAKITRAMFFGDSYVLGSGATNNSSGWAAQVAQMLGFDDPYFNGKSGTGYLRPGSGTGAGRKFVDRIPDTVTPYAPDLLIVMGGYNDNTANLPGTTESQLQTAAADFYAALATALPNTPVIVFGKQASRTPSAEDISFSNAIKTAAQAAPNVKRFVDLIATPWIVGTGKVGTPTGSGNADVLISSDGAHPSQAGHDYFADRCADEIRAYLMDSAAA